MCVRARVCVFFNETVCVCVPDEWKVGHGFGQSSATGFNLIMET